MKQMKFFHFVAVIALAASAQVFRADAAPLAGTVTETMEGGRYTYVKVDADGESHWVASSHFDVAVGDKVTVPGGNPMKNFTSPSLNRTFDSILFAEEVLVDGKAATSDTKLPPGHPAVNASPHGMGGVDPSGAGSVDALSGEVVETMDAGNYTYVLVKDGDRTVWAASDRIEVKVGDTVSIPHGETVKDFESPTLGRKFDEIIFADAIIKGGGNAAQAAAAKSSYGTPSADPEAQKDVHVEQPEGGTSIAQIHALRKELAGKEVTVRGKVVKYTERVMDRNWLHIVDGSGEGATGDLAITTKEKTQVGAVVTATGVLSIDEDFGFSYQYSVLMKDAALTGE